MNPYSIKTILIIDNNNIASFIPNMNIYERAKAGMPIDLKNDKEYKELCVPEMQRSRTICHRMSILEPYDPKVRTLQEELFEG